jgi:hypothetical protein
LELIKVPEPEPPDGLLAGTWVDVAQNMVEACTPSKEVTDPAEVEEELRTALSSISIKS